ncbi:hypothetical protein ElyMa_006322300 [Elysia marginata]|uniref:Uncharacterized protein n=1 Tax=Elysia marginata TaxID=1093978 RepID=A0AAV4HJY2_9GAST|nr:hypothetical protein ElyMa_006322300 [Elysia marginata]
MEQNERREDCTDTGNRRADSHSPRKGKYYVQKDQLSPSFGRDDASTSDASDTSDADSDLSDYEGLNGKRGSYDLVVAPANSDDDVDGNNYDNASCLGDENGNSDNIRRCNTRGEKSNSDGKKTFGDKLENDDSDQDEFFDAVSEIEDTGKKSDNDGIILPDSSVVTSEENSEQDVEPPPPPATALPVLQSLRPDILEKYSLSQGWIERVNRSLVESSMPKESLQTDTISEPDIGREGNIDRQNFSNCGDQNSSGKRKGYALLDQLKKSASDNRHDYNPRYKLHEFLKRLPKTIPTGPISEPSTSELENSCLVTSSKDAPCSESDDTAPPTTTKLRRAAYVTDAKYRTSAKNGGVGYRLPVALRPRTASYMRAVSQNGRPCSGQNESDDSNDESAAVSFTKIKSSGSVLPVRTSVEGALIPTWSSLPVFSYTDDTDPTSVVLRSREHARDTPVYVKPAASGTESAYFSSDGDSCSPLATTPNDAAVTSSSRSGFDRHKLTVPQSHSQNPAEESSTSHGKIVKKRSQKRSSKVMDQKEPSEPSRQNNDGNSSPRLSDNASARSSVKLTNSKTTESNRVSSQDTHSDKTKKKRRKRPDYELSVDTENNVMRVNIPEPHGLKRKPAVRRKPVAFQSKVSFVV